MPSFKFFKRYVEILNLMGVQITYKQLSDAYFIFKHERSLSRECICGCVSLRFRCPKCNRVIGDMNA